MPFQNPLSAMNTPMFGSTPAFRVDESENLLDKIIQYSEITSVIAGDKSQAGGVIAEMLGTFSAFAAAGVALVMIYMWSVAVMHTAWEGEALGQRFSTLWTPIRSVMAVVFVAPFPGLGGLSVMMALILVLVGTSIQGANALYGSVLDYFEDNNGTILPGGSDGAYPDDSMIQTALLGETCMLYYNEFTGAMEAKANTTDLLKKLQNATQGEATMKRVAERSTENGKEKVTIRYGSEREGLETCGSVEVACDTAESTGDPSPICAASLDAVETGVSENVLGGGIPEVARQIYDRETNPSVEAVTSGLQAAIDGYSAQWIQSVSDNPDTDITLNFGDNDRFNGT